MIPGSAPTFKLGANMGPFAGGERVLQRYSTGLGQHLLHEASLSSSVEIEKDAGSYVAMFNQETGSSDIVYYTLDPEKFAKGAGNVQRNFAASDDLLAWAADDDGVIEKPPH